MPRRSIPVVKADVLHWQGLSWREIADQLNREYRATWQPGSVSGAVYRWHKAAREKAARLFR